MLGAFTADWGFLILMIDVDESLTGPEYNLEIVFI